MARFRLLIAVVIALLPALVQPASATSCSNFDKQLGLCSGVQDNTVVIEGSREDEGSSGGSGGPANPTPTSTPSRLDQCIYRMGAAINCDEEEAEPLPVTVRDIASFVPTPGQQRMEPDGWAVAGLNTNFYAITGPHIVAGTLLGRPADVRFTPIAFHWDYGDGTTATKSTKGTTWAAQGVGEFDPTPTSHVYEQVGNLTITLDITFAAEYRYDGSSWRPVVGTITLPANDLYIWVGTVKTVLVDEDCIQNPRGPGC